MEESIENPKSTVVSLINQMATVNEINPLFTSILNTVDNLFVKQFSIVFNNDTIIKSFLCEIAKDAIFWMRYYIPDLDIILDDSEIMPKIKIQSNIILTLSKDGVKVNELHEPYYGKYVSSLYNYSKVLNGEYCDSVYTHEFWELKLKNFSKYDIKRINTYEQLLESPVELTSLMLELLYRIISEYRYVFNEVSEPFLFENPKTLVGYNKTKSSYLTFENFNQKLISSLFWGYAKEYLYQNYLNNSILLDYNTGRLYFTKPYNKDDKSDYIASIVFNTKRNCFNLEVLYVIENTRSYLKYVSDINIYYDHESAQLYPILSLPVNFQNKTNEKVYIPHSKGKNTAENYKLNNSNFTSIVHQFRFLTFFINKFNFLFKTNASNTGLYSITSKWMSQIDILLFENDFLDSLENHSSDELSIEELIDSIGELTPRNQNNNSKKKKKSKSFTKKTTIEELNKCLTNKLIDNVCTNSDDEYSITESSTSADSIESIIDEKDFIKVNKKQKSGYALLKNSGNLVDIVLTTDSTQNSSIMTIPSKTGKGVFVVFQDETYSNPIHLSIYNHEAREGMFHLTNEFLNYGVDGKHLYFNIKYDNITNSIEFYSDDKQININEYVTKIVNSIKTNIKNLSSRGKKIVKNLENLSKIEMIISKSISLYFGYLIDIIHNKISEFNFKKGL